MDEQWTDARDARREAEAVVGPGVGARVLEPSPPAVSTAPWFADDPVALDESPGASGQGPAVAPSGQGPVVAPSSGTPWATWIDDHPEWAAWAAERWLGGPRRLPPTPDAAVLADTRAALHRLAAYVMAPTRHAATGRFGLRWTLGGFGTPFFVDGTGPSDRQIRVVGTTLVDQRGGPDGATRCTTVSSLADAARFLGTTIDPDVAAEHDTPALDDPEGALTVDPDAAAFLGAWFGMAFAALEAVRADPATVEPSRPQLWPGHFDPSIEAGAGHHRASYGASPGDPGEGGPYLYVSVWYPDQLALGARLPDGRWNATSFTGRLLPLDAFPPGADPVAVAVEFWTTTRNALDAAGPA